MNIIQITNIIFTVAGIIQEVRGIKPGVKIKMQYGSPKEDTIPPDINTLINRASGRMLRMSDVQRFHPQRTEGDNFKIHRLGE